MKAVVVREWGGLDKLSVEEIDPPRPGAGEIRIAMDIAPINLGDILVATGRYQVKPPLPFVPGGEGVGMVVEVGPGVSEYEIGDHVFVIGFKKKQTESSAVIGTYAEQAVAPVANAAKVPDEMKLAHAAVFRGNYETAYYSLVQAGRLRAGETVMALGAGGGVGFATIATAKALGARVIASASTLEKRALALEAGADAVIDSNDPAWRARVDDFTGGRGLDIVSDPVGGRYTELAFRALGMNGRHLVIGFATGEIPRLKGNLPLMKCAAFVGANYMRFSDEFPADANANREALFELYRQGRLRMPRIAHAYSLDRFRDGTDALSNGTNVGRSVLHISGRPMDQTPLQSTARF